MLSQTEHRDEKDVLVRAEKMVAAWPGGGSKPKDDDLREVLSALLLRARGLEWQLNEKQRTGAERDAQRKQSDNLFDFAPVGYFILDAQNTIIQANITACDMFGGAKAKLVNSPFLNYLESGFYEKFRTYVKDIAATGQRLSLDVKMRRADGVAFDAQLQTVVLYDNSRMTYRISVADISDRKRAEEALRTSEKRYRSFIEVTGELGWTTDVNGEVVEDIPSFRKFTGQTFEEVKGCGWTAALHPDDVEHTVEVWQKATAERTAYETEYRLRRHDGVYRHFLARGIPVLHEDGTVKEWVGTCIDITERKEFERAVAESQRRYRELVESFAATIFETDSWGSVTFVNNNGAQSFGLTQDDVARGVNIFDFVAEEMKDTAANKFARVTRVKK